MASPFPFEPMLVFGWLASMLHLGVLLRAWIPFFQRFLLPGCLLGGIAGLVFIHTRMIEIAAHDLETFAYHLFNISFFSVGLTRSSTRQKSSSRGKAFINGPAWMVLTEL